MNSKMDTASSNPKYNRDSADLVGEWKAFRQHVEFVFKGPLRSKNEEERFCYSMLWVGEKGRRIFSTWNITDAQQKVLKEYYDRFQAYVQPNFRKTQTVQQDSRTRCNCPTVCNRIKTAGEIL